MKTINVLALVAAFLILLHPSSVLADTADDVKCTGCVGSPDILDFGIKTKDLGVGAVTTPKINDGAVNWKKLATDLQQRIEQLEATVAALEAAVADNTVLKLDGYLDLDTTDPAKPTARFAGVNVQIVNGLGGSWRVNGVGNLIIGYDELYDVPDPFAVYICSDGQWRSQMECESNGEIWSLNHKSGSHNIVIGSGHRYSTWGGLIVGWDNAVNGSQSSVAGANNIASGAWSSIAGGEYNIATEEGSVVGGGSENSAEGAVSVVSGGFSNNATGFASAVSGGSDRAASGNSDWVAGGLWQDN